MDKRDTMDNDDVIDALDKLVETCRDGEDGFRSSAEHARSAELRAIFSECAESCRRGASELQAEVARLGGKPKDDSSTTGALHRGWVNLKAALTGRDDKAILEECERAEDAALARYRDALKKPLPSDVMAIVQRQYEGAKRNHDRIRTLRDSTRANA